MKTKRILIPALAVLSIFSLFATACDPIEEASVKIKFYDSLNDKLIYPSSYDFEELKEFYVTLEPTKEGYTFDGWYLDKDCTTEFDIDTFSSSASLVNVYAKWTELRKIVTYSGSNKLNTYYYDDLVAGTNTIVNASKDGYTFSRWTLDSEGTQAFDLATYTYPTDKKTVNLFAQFNIITSVTFMNGKSQVSKEILSELKDGTASLPEVEKDGYNFDGWYLDEAFTNRFNVESYIGETSSIKVYAKWTAKPVVSYYDGETLLKSFYLEDSATEVTPTPTKEGYDFVGWVDSVGEVFTLNTEATTNQVAYAKWEQKVTVRFMNGETEVSHAYLDQLTASTLPTATKDTWTFVNWYTDKACTNLFNLDTYVATSKEVKVYAKFVRNTVIQFMNGNELIAERSLAGLKDATLTNPTITKYGYNFVKWSTDIEGNNTFNPNNVVTDELEVKVYAQWSEKTKVTYYVDNEVNESKYLEEITNTYLPTEPTKYGYDFVKWVDAKGNDFVLDVNSDVNLVAYAKFEQKVTIRFMNGENEESSAFLDTLSQSTLPQSSKETYTFKGWYTDADCNNPFIVEGFSTTVKDVKVYAKFEKIVDVIFMNGTEEVTRMKLSALKDGSSTVPTVTKAGFIFDGWYYNETKFVKETFTTEEDQIILVAQWTEKAKVTYIVDNATYDSKYLEDISNDYEPTAPTKAGYDFVGWFVGDNEFVLDVTSEESLTATAKFEQKVTIRFMNGENEESSAFLDTLSQSTLPTSSKETYTFKGWFTDENCTNPFIVEGFSTTIKDVKVYAKFEKIVTVHFISETSEIGSSLLSALKEGSSTAPVATKYGYNFVKWYLDASLENEFDIDSYTTEEGSINVYAKFVERAKLILNVDGVNYNDIYLFELATYTTTTYTPSTVPTKDGFFFKGWAVSLEENAEEAVLDATLIDETENVIIYATWYANPTIEGLTSTEENSSIKVSWSVNSNYTYELKLDNGSFESITDPYYVLPTDATVGSHKITLRATFLGHSVEESIDVVQKVKITLTNDDFSFDKDTRIIRWSAIEDADYYLVKFNNATEWTKLTHPYFEIASNVAAGTYDISINVYINGVSAYEAKTFTVTVVSVERVTETGLFIDEDDQYILLAGGSYSFGTLTFKEADWYTLSEDNTKITVNEDEAGFTGYLVTTTDLKMKVRVENYISSISYGSNYAYYKNASKTEFDSEDNKTAYKVLNNAYEIGTSDSNYYLDLDIEGSGEKDTDYELIFTGKANNDSNIATYFSIIEVNGKYHLEWTSAGKALADGTSIELVIRTHYYTAAQGESYIPYLTFNFITNKGANVYDFASLKEAVENLNNDVVNMHKVITITDADVPETYGTIPDGVDPKSAAADTYNTSDHQCSLIRRNDNRTDKNDFRLNGNYFEIDASKLRLGKSREQLASGTNYVYWQRCAVILINDAGGNTTYSVDKDGTTYYYTDRKSAIIENFRIKGNAYFGISSTIVAEGQEAISAELLKQSGAIDGIVCQGFKADFNNVVIHHCTEAVKFVRTNYYDSQLKSYVYINNNYDLLENCSIGDNWANDSYIWSTGELEYKDSFIYDTSGVAIVVGNNCVDTNNKDNAIEYTADGVRLCNFCRIIFNNSEVSNFKLGSEEYFTAYNMADFVLAQKVTMENNVSAGTNGQYTLVKTTEKGNLVNMAIQTNNNKDGKEEPMCGSFDICIIANDGSEVWSYVRQNKTSNTTYTVDHSMASSAGAVLLPVCEYSNSITSAVTEELTGMGAIMTTLQADISGAGAILTTIQTELTNAGTYLANSNYTGLATYLASTTYLNKYDIPEIGAKFAEDSTGMTFFNELYPTPLTTYLESTTYLRNYTANDVATSLLTDTTGMSLFSSAIVAPLNSYIPTTTYLLKYYNVAGFDGITNLVNLLVNGQSDVAGSTIITSIPDNTFEKLYLTATAEMTTLTSLVGEYYAALDSTAATAKYNEISTALANTTYSKYVLNESALLGSYYGKTSADYSTVAANLVQYVMFTTAFNSAQDALTDDTQILVQVSMGTGMFDGITTIIACAYKTSD